MPGLGFKLDVKVEGVVKELLKAGLEFCPYNRALKHDIVVNELKGTEKENLVFLAGVDAV
ncbi:hypothetical protein C8J56DRAFT_1037967 [Mycena floridula]|nr:hypothetical protein C8J56DRAFT_1037967 [Mycena floridula]